MSNYFQKYKKSATALVLVFAVSYPASLSATSNLQSWDNINEEADSLDAVSGRFVVSRRNVGGVGFDDPTQSIPEIVPYDLGRQAAKDDLQVVKNSVIRSDLLTYPDSYETHQGSFKQKIRTAYNNTALFECPNFLDRVQDFSVKLFKVSQNHLSKSKDRNEWAKDDTLGGYFTFTLNKDQKVSLLIPDLNVVLPLYMEHRRSHLDSLAPYGVDLTPDQRITGQFINRILSGEIPGDPLKRGIKFRLQNQTGLSLDELVNRFTGRNLPLQIQGVEDRERSVLRGLIETWQEFERNNPNPLRILDYIRNTRNSPFLVKYPDFALEVGQKIVARRKEEIKQTGDRERIVLRGLIETWQEGEKTNSNPFRILDYIRNTRNSPLLVKYPALSFEVGHQIVIRRKSELTKQPEDQERLLLQTLIYKWQEGEKTNPNPSRILDYIRNTRNSPLLVKYPDFALEVGQKIVARRKEELNDKC